MIYLSNGCYCSNPIIQPKNWNTKHASCDSVWSVFYRFYDPTITDSNGRVVPKKVEVKAGVNRLTTVAERRAAIKQVLETELSLLKEKGYNPITKQYMIEPEAIEYIIDPNVSLYHALEAARLRLNIGNRTRIDMKSIVKAVGKAAEQLRFHTMKVSEIRRRHLKAILDRCGANSKQWSPGRYNTYRAYLMMLYKELVELETVDYNLLKDISKKPVEHKRRTVLSADDRQRVNEHLAKTFPRFHAFIHLFFHSGGRKTELLQLKPGDVDLINQKYRCVIKKRKTPKEVERTIKTVALPYWKLFLDNCPEDHYLFGPKFEPALKPMGIGMPTSYWRREVKEVLGIKQDLYSLKHLNTSEVVDALDDQAAAALNGHTSTAMVVQIYDVKRKDREHERLKNVGNPFA